jgi:hypothetical protein
MSFKMWQQIQLVLAEKLQNIPGRKRPERTSIWREAKLPMGAIALPVVKANARPGVFIHGVLLKALANLLH